MKKIIFENLTSRGVNRGVTQFHAQFTQVSRQFLAFNRKQKKLFKENCFENMVSVLSKTNPMCPSNYFEKKVCSQVFKFFGFLLFCTFFSRSFYGLTQESYHQSETILSKQFSLNNFFCFLLKAENCLETCVNCA